jgi:hypothetical protein
VRPRTERRSRFCRRARDRPRGDSESTAGAFAAGRVPRPLPSPKRLARGPPPARFFPGGLGLAGALSPSWHSEPARPKTPMQTRPAACTAGLFPGVGPSPVRRPRRWTPRGDPTQVPAPRPRSKPSSRPASACAASRFQGWARRHWCVYRTRPRPRDLGDPRTHRRPGQRVTAELFRGWLRVLFAREGAAIGTDRGRILGDNVGGKNNRLHSQSLGI